mmetsp:Transcript_46328/g.111490  ORF Transcript_46328/g.111490 Transcript_46328/m.111490 type:complete len:302 (+) Transcript_46328:660-1565(+)
MSSACWSLCLSPGATLDVPIRTPPPATSGTEQPRDPPTQPFSRLSPLGITRRIPRKTHDCFSMRPPCPVPCTTSCLWSMKPSSGMNKGLTALTLPDTNFLAICTTSASSKHSSLSAICCNAALSLRSILFQAVHVIPCGFSPLLPPSTTHLWRPTLKTRPAITVGCCCLATRKPPTTTAMTTKATPHDPTKLALPASRRAAEASSPTFNGKATTHAANTTTPVTAIRTKMPRQQEALEGGGWCHSRKSRTRRHPSAVLCSSSLLWRISPFLSFLFVLVVLHSTPPSEVQHLTSCERTVPSS